MHKWQEKLTDFIPLGLQGDSAFYYTSQSVEIAQGLYSLPMHTSST